jgi:hypothetical protein
MARLRHAESGVVVSVTDEKATRMGAEWVPEGKASAKKATAKKAAAKKSSK